MREQSARRYLLDDSGNSARPHPDSNIPAHNRVEYMSHKGMHDFLLGKGLVPFFERFERVLSGRLPLLECGDEWIERRDLFEFMALELTPTILTAMCGPALLQQSPDFPRLFWEYDESLPTLFEGLPRWLTPRAYARRDSLLASIKTWQRYATEETSKAKVQSDGEEVPFWGSRYFRDRQKTLLAVDGYDEDAVGSEMLGTIWA
ncbi:hypothetical protein DIS24_g10265 [Lasiodiplodia hormozganensis]|uniref:Uncharacterized protein n=1 Tax=Lasiodiplodia hormozganensis TaxID=869390 RepID=A0AA39XPT9_9PEZI|nr:hypothetical protein DIS24_g10265 [Lasiodiplodia hormozganensis]